MRARPRVLSSGKTRSVCRCQVWPRTWNAPSLLSAPITSAASSGPPRSSTRAKRRRKKRKKQTFRAPRSSVTRPPHGGGAGGRGGGPGPSLAPDDKTNRHSWHRDFMLKFRNVRMIPSKLTVRFHSAEGDRLHSPPTMQVTGKLARPDGGGIFVDDFKFLASVARATPKITLPSPTVMHFRGGRG